MSKPLTDMSLEELWELFPIELVEHRDCWDDWYREEASALDGILPPDLPHAIHHVGSTAIDGIWAKPIVDILVELPDDAAIEFAQERLAVHGYLVMADRDLNKGYTPEGFAERVFHIHLRVAGDNDELYFRDYLNAHPDVAREYERLSSRSGGSSSTTAMAIRLRRLPLSASTRSSLKPSLRRDP